MDILQNVIHDERLAWEKSLDHKIETLIITLDKKSINELNQKIDNLKFSIIEDFPNLQKEIEKLKNKF